MGKTYLLSEVSFLKGSCVIRYNSFGCSSSNGRRTFSIRMPNLINGQNGYAVRYVDYTPGNRISLELEYDMSKPGAFKETFNDLFSLLTNFDLNYVAEKILTISELHNLSYDSHCSPGFSKVSSEYMTALTGKGEWMLSDIGDDSVIKQIYVYKTFASGGAPQR